MEVGPPPSFVLSESDEERIFHVDAKDEEEADREPLLLPGRPSPTPPPSLQTNGDKKENLFSKLKPGSGSYLKKEVRQYFPISRLSFICLTPAFSPGHLMTKPPLSYPLWSHFIFQKSGIGLEFIDSDDDLAEVIARNLEIFAEHSEDSFTRFFVPAEVRDLLARGTPNLFHGQ